MTVLMESVPSAAALGQKYEEWCQRNMTEEDRRITEVLCSAVNVEELKLAASRAVGDRCTGAHMTGQGGFNLIYMLTFEHSSDVVARINGSFIKQDKEQSDDMIAHRIDSEAATLKYVQAATSIPVPRVYAVESSLHNPVKARYTLQERILGRNLADVWLFLTIEQLDIVIPQVANIEAQLLQTRFSAIGSLTEVHDGQISVGPLGLSCTHPLNLQREYGPWTSFLDWLKAYVVAELESLESEQDEWLSLRSRWRIINRDAEASIQPIQHIDYFKTYYHLVIDGMESLDASGCDSQDCLEEMPFVLWHEDISLTNILVAYDDPTRIVGLVDWEGASIVPLWACFGHEQSFELIEGDDLIRLQRLRDSTHERHLPMIRSAKDPGFPFQYLQFIASSRGSVMRSVEASKSYAKDFFARCGTQYSRHFQKLFDFVKKGSI
ncbi:uncharacterized protein LAESUDRAFT_727644 [Laetiporus sulphureus 93-53]|uniref:Aminoglycoside phosphotransferase domain-containing protein n=1 Tax=Laetiporus sulphureus 93-53 TaxID=1314785 RepID=A0A165DFK3_9APHY|nr:uncharacterized protein LAESUDRAFT_727644 [Laetiporus sulphureus 93-53]KZT04786.1 hypothetical protein LAESUDRAFT_727644 [Laetiporus sulphureus 93-53]